MMELFDEQKVINKVHPIIGAECRAVHAGQLDALHPTWNVSGKDPEKDTYSLFMCLFNLLYQSSNS